MYSLGIVTQAFLGIILTLDSWIYSLISSAYKIFMAIASARILSSDAYTAIANKVYVIVGVGMLFVLAYAVMKAIIDPDQMSKGDMAGGKILKSIAVAVIGLIVTPLLFDLAYMAQGKMLEDDILGKLFFRTGESTVDSLTGGDPVNYDEELQNTGGAVAAVSVWRAFFYPVDGEDPDKIIADPEIARLNATVSAVGCAALAIGTAVAAYFSAGLALVVGGGAVASCISAVQKDEAADMVEEAAKDGEVSLSEAYVMVASGESFAIFQAFLDPVDEGQIRYTWFISTVCGAFVAYAFVSYAIDMGLRAAKLAYYQIIAPVPLILGVLPKNGDTVSKFAKGVLSTFMEVFVRISVVYIVVYIIAHLNELFSTVGALWDNDNLTNVESLIAMALLIIGLVLFAKEAPKIIGETFGLKGDAGLKGLNIMDKLRRGEVFTAGTIAGTAIRSGVQGFRHNFNKRQTTDLAGNKHDRGAASRVIGGIGSAIGGAVTGGVRSGVGRVRGGRDGYVKSGREMRDHIERNTRDIQDNRKRRDKWHDENQSFGDKMTAMGRGVGDAIYRWAAGDEDLSQEQADMKFAGGYKTLRDNMREEAFKKDAAAKAIRAQKEKLEAEEIDQYADGWSEDSRIAEIRRRMLADATYQAREAAYTDAKRVLGEKETAVKSAETAYQTARESGADAATLAGLEDRIRDARREHSDAQAAFNTASASFKAREKKIIDDVDAVAMVDDETLTRRKIERQNQLKELNDRAEAAADRYVADELRKEDSIIRNMAQTFVSENSEYISRNANRTLYTGVDANGDSVDPITVRELVSDAFGEGAVNGSVITGDSLRTGNTFIITNKGANPDGSDLVTTYQMSFNDRTNSFDYIGTRPDGTTVTLSKAEFDRIMVDADSIEANTHMNTAADRGKKIKNAVPLTRTFIEKSTRIRKNKEGGNK